MFWIKTKNARELNNKENCYESETKNQETLPLFKGLIYQVQFGINMPAGTLLLMGGYTYLIVLA